ncbi:adenylate/guanylate cyclase domain-containing protein [Methylobacterium sp. OAE515]|uniref:adenylate/guanylate cyclase domain-containing protein n=1 Tax=Methylobacterium sp. OAE515 TaxID=2817895 RepID=UPI00178B1562
MPIRIGTRESLAGLRDQTLRWLLSGTICERYLDNILVAFCERLRAGGVSVARATLHLSTHHPQWLGIRILWQLGISEPRSQPLAYGYLDAEAAAHGPVAAILSGAERVHRRLHAEGTGTAGAAMDPLYRLDGQGLTDYVAWPLRFTLGKRHMADFASDHPDGFSDAERDLLEDLLPALAVVVEVRHKNRLTRLLLDTYVGPHAGEMILDGVTRRGSGTTMEAAVLIADLRGFTELAERRPRDEVIGTLNDFFDAICAPIERNGGEILKFMGDGLLATFPLSEPDACRATLRTAREACSGMKALNRDRAGRGLSQLGYGIGVNVGIVTYGNIGSHARLDFTMIGSAVNVAARLENLTKVLGYHVLFSGAFAALAHDGGELARLGTFPLRGLAKPLEVFTFEAFLSDGGRPAARADDRARHHQTGCPVLNE